MWVGSGKPSLAFLPFLHLKQTAPGCSAGGSLRPSSLVVNRGSKHALFALVRNFCICEVGVETPFFLPPLSSSHVARESQVPASVRRRHCDRLYRGSKHPPFDPLRNFCACGWAWKPLPFPSPLPPLQNSTSLLGRRLSASARVVLIVSRGSNSPFFCSQKEMFVCGGRGNPFASLSRSIFSNSTSLLGRRLSASVRANPFVNRGSISPPC